MAKLPNPLKAVLFDFDGTLADSYPAIAASVNHVRDVRGHPPLSVEVVKSFVGKGPEYLLSNTIPGGNVDDDLATCDGCRLVHRTSDLGYPVTIEIKPSGTRGDEVIDLDIVTLVLIHPNKLVPVLIDLDRR